MSTMAEHTQGSERAAKPKKKLTREQTRVQIRAARLRVTTDKHLGRETPQWIKDVASRPI